MFDMENKFIPEMLQHCSYRHCGSITQRTDRSTLDVIR